MQVPNLLFIVELKIWRDNKYEEHGRDQLSAYLATRGMGEGYLVTFDFSKKGAALPSVATKKEPTLPSIATDQNNAEPQWIEWNGKRIFEVIA